MKRSDTPTGFVMIKAYNNSEWDFCDYAIIRLTGEWLATLRTRLDAAAAFAGDYTFYHLSYWDVPEGFYTNDEEEETGVRVTDILQEDEGWAFVETDEDELQSLKIPENSLATFELHLSATGSAHYTVYGKHTGEEFWTAGFDAADLLKVLDGTLK